MKQNIDVLLGLQWGDEGKGKIVDVLTPKYDVVARFQGGPNAGHTLEFNGKKFVLRSIPSGIFQGGQTNIIGNGVVLDPALFKGEAEDLVKAGYDLTKNLYISKKAHLILPTHRILDAAYEAAKKLEAELAESTENAAEPQKTEMQKLTDSLTKLWQKVKTLFGKQEHQQEEPKEESQEAQPKEAAEEPTPEEEKEDGNNRSD